MLKRIESTKLESSHKNLYYVYVLECADKSLYTGITNNLENRVEKHNLGTASKYTRGRRPVKVIYYEQAYSKSAALKREIQIKKLKKEDKIKLVKTNLSEE